MVDGGGRDHDDDDDDDDDDYDSLFKGRFIEFTPPGNEMSEVVSCCLPHRQLWMSNLSKVDSLWLEVYSNLQPSGYRTQNIPLHHHVPLCILLVYRANSKQVIDYRTWLGAVISQVAICLWRGGQLVGTISLCSGSTLVQGCYCVENLTGSLTHHCSVLSLFCCFCCCLVLCPSELWLESNPSIVILVFYFK